MGGLKPRDPRAAAAVTYDLIVVGGGIYGVMLALEAARRRVHTLLLERADFGGGTSWNHLRIIHGGLRYLQSLDLERFRESVIERRWFLRHFPDLVEPLECLMPLYGDGLRRPLVLRAALAMNDFLARRRDHGVRPDRVLPAGRVIDAGEVARRFPTVDREGLSGAAVWYDAVAPNPQRLLMEALRWAESYGARALNYVEAGRLASADGKVRGVLAVDRETGDRYEYRAPVVVNCAGPWSTEVAARFDREMPDLFRPSVALNVLLDREPLAASALAVTPRRAGARTYFMYPWRGRVLAGTYHAPFFGGPREVEPTADQIGDFLSDLNFAVPGWDLRRDDVLHTFAGLLPAEVEGTERLSSRAVIRDHAPGGGPAGLWSVSGVKFTTARAVAEKALRAIFPNLSADPDALAGTERPMPLRVPEWPELERLREQSPAAASNVVRRIIDEEAVVHGEDLTLRRTDWGLDPRAPRDIERAIAGLLAEPEPAGRARSG